MDEQIYSASSITTFLRCPKQWEYAYVYAFIQRSNIRQLVGIAVHEAVETNYRQKLESRRDLAGEAVVDAFQRVFDAGDADPDPKESVEAARASGTATVLSYMAEVAPTVQPFWVEHEVQYKIDGIPYGGTIDLVDDRGRVRDLKTKRRRPAKGDNSFVLAMTGYALGYRHETGKLEKEIVLDYMVRTRQPYYWPVSSDGPATNGAVNRFAQIVGQINHSVTKGSFPATGPQNRACSWCPYKAICPDADW